MLSHTRPFLVFCLNIQIKSEQIQSKTHTHCGFSWSIHIIQLSIGPDWSKNITKIIRKLFKWIFRTSLLFKKKMKNTNNKNIHKILSHTHYHPIRYERFIHGHLILFCTSLISSYFFVLFVCIDKQISMYWIYTDHTNTSTVVSLPFGCELPSKKILRYFFLQILQT